MDREVKKRYSLIGPSAEQAARQGLVAAEWYHTDVPRARMKQLMRRTDGRACRDTALWFALLGAFGFGGYWSWGTWACVPFFVGYGLLYASASDARWHETSHGTAFKTQWLNDALYQLASFMNLFEPTLWRWSHARHHTDTSIVGRDREFTAMRPPDILRLLANVLRLSDVAVTAVSVVRHAAGHMTADEQTYIPESEWSAVYGEARVWVATYAVVIGSAVYLDSWLPLMYVGLPSLYGYWLVYLFSIAQHAGLAEDVLDHRLNSRTIYMNPVFRFIFWNMNYHVEHHMFPMVPYHALAALHEQVQYDMPTPYPSLFAALREIIPTLWRQRREPEYYVRRELPPTAQSFRPELHRVVFES